MFVLQEMQADGEDHVAFLPQVVRETRPEIESVFYQACASAVVSSVPVHTVMVYTEEGFLIPDLTKCFKHFE